ncbi:MAG: O-phospho-L-seryl-tRNA:Cys-tRNA synthase [Methanocalculus sp. 52_23]|nr:MAG: O-phospho-L-seryl-tRNA:Cys-tRNA synthase [Methanocalculus sp. 52_23]
MSIRVQKLFEAIFTLEDMREIYRGSIPTGLDTVEETAFDEKIAELKAILPSR